MTNLKKLSFVILIISFFAVLFLITPSFADGNYGLDKSAEKAGLQNNIGGKTSIFEVLGLVISAVLSLVGIVFFALTLFSGLMWMTARGDSARVDKAKGILESAAIGLMIVMGSYAIVNFVFSSLAGKTNGGSCSTGTACSANQKLGTCNPVCKTGEVCCVAR